MPKKLASNKLELPTIEEMANAGVHFGHRTRRWHPKMRPFIYGSREGIHLINLEKTRENLEKAAQFLASQAQSGSEILIVGTKRQAVKLIEDKARRSNIHSITSRWPGGLLTNFESLENTIQHYKTLGAQLNDEKYLSNLTTRDKYKLRRLHTQLGKLVGGLGSMTRVPDVMIIIDPRREHAATTEARLTKTPIVGIVDTNTDPSLVNYPIPANDDALKSIELIVSCLIETIQNNSSKPTLKATQV